MTNTRQDCACGSPRPFRARLCLACQEKRFNSPRTCASCNVIKPADSFYPHRKTTRHTACKSCQNLATLCRRYRITPDELDAMLVAQDGRCAICDELPDNFVVDHDHASGAVRALLCQSCNVAIGLMRDNPARLRAAAVYLEGH